LEARNPGRALAIYERLSESPGSWAAPALYARGRLLFDQKRMTEARRIFKRYESRYPSGDNVADVARLLRKIDGRTSE
jgi:TolA-binding protein